MNFTQIVLGLLSGSLETQGSANVLLDRIINHENTPVEWSRSEAGIQRGRRKDETTK